MNKKALAAFLAVCLFNSGASPNKAMAGPGGSVSRPYEWTIEIDTQDMPNKFQYHGSTLTKVIKTSLKYASQASPDNMIPYEDLWYSNSKTLGLERHGKLDLKQGDAIAIKVVHKGSNPMSPTNEEQRAAGKAVMKAIVDATINKNMVATIKVPTVSFNAISSEIQNYHFSPAPTSGGVETPINSDMNLFMESEPAGLTQSFIHYH